MVAAALLFAFSLYAVQRWLEQDSLTDVGGYKDYANFVRAGHVPYSHQVHMPLAYPPAALVPWLVASYMRWRYATSFTILMGVCGVGCIALIATTLRKVDASRARIWAALLLFAVSPLVLGSLFGTRYDLWPTLLALGGLTALVYERPVLGGGLLGLGFAAKLWPGVLLPLAVVHLWRRRGGGAAGAAVVVVRRRRGRVLRSLRDPRAARTVVEHHGPVRPAAADREPRLGGAHGARASRDGDARDDQLARRAGARRSRRAVRRGPVHLGARSFAVLGILIVYARRRTPSPEALLMAAAATLAALVAFDKVLSPQYLIWLVPFVALACGRAGIAAGAFLLLALGLTQTWFPWNYWQLASGHESPWVWYLLARDLALVALAAALAGLQPRIRFRRRKSTFAGRSASLRMR